MQPHYIAPGNVVYELFKISADACGINIQKCSIMCCQVSLCLLSVMLGVICIPLALGWSGPMPIDATCHAF